MSQRSLYLYLSLPPPRPTRSLVLSHLRAQHGGCRGGQQHRPRTLSGTRHALSFYHTLSICLSLSRTHTNTHTHTHLQAQHGGWRREQQHRPRTRSGTRPSPPASGSLPCRLPPPATPCVRSRWADPLQGYRAKWHPTFDSAHLQLSRTKVFSQVSPWTMLINKKSMTPRNPALTPRDPVCHHPRPAVKRALAGPGPHTSPHLAMELHELAQRFESASHASA